MSRKRSISSDISIDGELGEVAEKSGLLPLILYTWAIPHADDWGRLTGNAREFRALVCPQLDVTTKDVDEALEALAIAQKWERYTVDGRQVIAFPQDSWYKHQSYINTAKRQNDTSVWPSIATEQQNTADGNMQNTEEQQETPQNPASSSLTPSPSPTGEEKDPLTPNGGTVSGDIEFEPTSTGDGNRPTSYEECEAYFNSRGYWQLARGFYDWWDDPERNWTSTIRGSKKREPVKSWQGRARTWISKQRGNIDPAPKPPPVVQRELTAKQKLKYLPAWAQADPAAAVRNQRVAMHQ